MSLDLKKAEVELIKVQAAKADFELKIMERHAEIKRMEDQINIQIKREKELKEQIKILRGSE